MWILPASMGFYFGVVHFIWVNFEMCLRVKRNNRTIPLLKFVQFYFLKLPNWPSRYLNRLLICWTDTWKDDVWVIWAVSIQNYEFLQHYLLKNSLWLFEKVNCPPFCAQIIRVCIEFLHLSPLLLSQPCFPAANLRNILRYSLWQTDNSFSLSKPTLLAALKQLI